MEPKPIVVDLTAAQRLGCEKLGKCLWLLEELSVAEISRRRLLEHLLWAERERGIRPHWDCPQRLDVPSGNEREAISPALVRWQKEPELPLDHHDQQIRENTGSAAYM